ncbi:hypothetical protein JX265_013691 [Neoarthrinium moseri]|uniref:Uncharacterized protein n=1 Tax=Neoarthrinium moseri TaxID=1658444 RepID=A0A9Q0AIH5_9PEZI|nr:hypothetical protein JX265_013691 [Neoarthrinium moseri]
MYAGILTSRNIPNSLGRATHRSMCELDCYLSSGILTVASLPAAIKFINLDCVRDTPLDAFNDDAEATGSDESVAEEIHVGRKTASARPQTTIKLQQPQTAEQEPNEQR